MANGLERGTVCATLAGHHQGPAKASHAAHSAETSAVIGYQIEDLVRNLWGATLGARGGVSGMVFMRPM